MRDWLMMLGTFAEGLVFASIAAYGGGPVCFAVACLAGGWCVAQRDHLYQNGRAAR